MICQHRTSICVSMVNRAFRRVERVTFAHAMSNHFRLVSANWDRHICGPNSRGSLGQSGCLCDSVWGWWNGIVVHALTDVTATGVGGSLALAVEPVLVWACITASFGSGVYTMDRVNEDTVLGTLTLSAGGGGAGLVVDSGVVVCSVCGVAFSLVSSGIFRSGLGMGMGDAVVYTPSGGP